MTLLDIELERTKPLAPSPELVLRPGGASAGYWAELWRYRELFAFLAWRDLKVR